MKKKEKGKKGKRKREGRGEVGSCIAYPFLHVSPRFFRFLICLVFFIFFDIVVCVDPCGVIRVLFYFFILKDGRH